MNIVAKRYAPVIVENPPELATANELAVWLRCTPATIKRWGHTGIIPAPVKLGRLQLWRTADVLTVLAQREVAQ